MAQAFVDKYNAEYKCSLQIQHYSDNGFSLPYINNNNIHIDKSNFIWLAFYFFGNHRKLIFAKDRSGEKKSLYVEAQWNVPDAIDKHEWDMIVEQAFDEAMAEIYGE